MIVVVVMVMVVGVVVEVMVGIVVVMDVTNEEGLDNAFAYQVHGNMMSPTHRAHWQSGDSIKPDRG